MYFVNRVNILYEQMTNPITLYIQLILKTINYLKVLLSLYTIQSWTIYLFHLCFFDSSKVLFSNYFTIGILAMNSSSFKLIAPITLSISALFFWYTKGYVINKLLANHRKNASDIKLLICQIMNNVNDDLIVSLTSSRRVTSLKKKVSLSIIL
jgi:hypothetical protein